MANAYFEDHPTDPNKVILRKRPCPFCQDKPRTWQGLTDEELKPICDEYRILFGSWVNDFARAIESKIKERNT